MEILIRATVLVGRCIRSKFGQALNIWEALYFSQVLSHFIPFINLSLACGNLIRFWNDPSVSRPPFRVHFPRQFNISSLKDGLVSKFCHSPHNWDFHFRRNFTDLEIMEFADLSFLIYDHIPTLSWSVPRNWLLTLSGLSRFPPLLLCLLIHQIPPFLIGLFGFPLVV